MNDAINADVPNGPIRFVSPNIVCVKRLVAAQASARENGTALIEEIHQR
jgi:hypothetical protein